MKVTKINFSLAIDYLQGNTFHRPIECEAVAVGVAVITDNDGEIEVEPETFRIEARTYVDGERAGTAVISDGYSLINYQENSSLFKRLLERIQDAYCDMVAHGESESASIYKEAQKIQYVITTHEAVEVAA